MSVVMKRPIQRSKMQKSTISSLNSSEGSSKILNDGNTEKAGEVISKEENGVEISSSALTIASMSVTAAAATPVVVRPPTETIAIAATPMTPTAIKTDKTGATVASASAASASANIIPGGPSTTVINKAIEANDKIVDVKEKIDVGVKSTKEPEGQQKEGQSLPISMPISSATSLPSSAMQSSPKVTIAPLSMLSSVSADAAKIFEEHRLLQEKLNVEQTALKSHTTELHQHNLNDLQKNVRLAIEKARQIVSVLISESNDLNNLHIALCQAIKSFPHYGSELNKASRSMLSYHNELSKLLQVAIQNGNAVHTRYNHFYSNVIDKIKKFPVQNTDNPNPVVSTNPLSVNNEQAANGNGFYLFALLRRNMGIKISHMCSNLLHLKAIISRLKKLNIVYPVMHVLDSFSYNDSYEYQRQAEGFGYSYFKQELITFNETTKKIRTTLSNMSTLMLRFELAAKTNNSGLSDMTEVALITGAPIIGAKAVITSLIDAKTNADIKTKVDEKTKADEKTKVEGQAASTASAASSSSDQQEGVSQTHASAANITASAKANTTENASAACITNTTVVLKTASAAEASQQSKEAREQLNKTTQALAASAKAIERLELNSAFDQMQMTEKKLRQIICVLKREFNDLRQLNDDLRFALCRADQKLSHDNKKYLSADKRIQANAEQCIELLQSLHKKDNTYNKFLDLANTVCKVRGVNLREIYDPLIDYPDTDSLKIYDTAKLSPFQLILTIRHNMGIKISNISMDFTHLQSLISKLWHLPYEGFEEIVVKVIYQPEFDIKRMPSIRKDLYTHLVEFNNALLDLKRHSKKMKTLLYKISDDLQIIEDAVKTNGQSNATLQELIDIIDLPIMDVNPANASTAAATISAAVNVIAVRPAPPPPAPSAPPSALVFSNATNASSTLVVLAPAAAAPTLSVAANTAATPHS